MTRLRIQLPDELYQRAKAFAAERELSLAEISRRGIELFLARFPSTRPPEGPWQLPQVDGGGIHVPLAELRDIFAEEETLRSLPRP